MKTLKIFFVQMLLLGPCLAQAQFVPKKPATTTKVKKPVKKTPEVRAIPANTQTAVVQIRETKGCRPLAAASVNTILTKVLAHTLSVKLDREDSYIRFNGQTQRLSISDYKVKKPAHDWVYFMNDVNSTKAVATFDEQNRRFYLKITFEGDRSEIKGKCPGCINRYEDSRAPDINWLGNRELIIELKPIVHNNSIAFEATGAELKGHFTINGPVQAFLPGLTTYFERQIMSAVEAQAKRLMNTTGVKNMMANTFRGTVNTLGLGNIDTVETGENHLYICNN
ncbi:MAG: hypothetical protein NXH86_09130 [Flavobacteriaceae bacterium]|uniref:hypothetical protein n=1 Tax=Flagellimonas sp. SN16 TaxID=3415142 RepID=UPI003C3CCCE2|nr:hypothetical protein [Flavobacteriaceae bacterium]